MIISLDQGHTFDSVGWLQGLELGQRKFTTSHCRAVKEAGGGKPGELIVMKTGEEKTKCLNELWGDCGNRKDGGEEVKYLQWFPEVPAFVENLCQDHIDANLRYIERGCLRTLNCTWPGWRLSYIYKCTF